MKLIVTALFALALQSSQAQRIFKEHFKGCNTSHFALEMDTANAKIDPQDFAAVFKRNIPREQLSQMQGRINFQILVDTLGNSCLLSLENNSNMKTRRLQLKQFIDSDLKFTPPSQPVAVIVVVDFKGELIESKRLGLSGKSMEWHELKN